MTSPHCPLALQLHQPVPLASVRGPCWDSVVTLCWHAKRLSKPHSPLPTPWMKFLKHMESLRSNDEWNESSRWQSWVSFAICKQIGWHHLAERRWQGSTVALPHTTDHHDFQFSEKSKMVFLLQSSFALHARNKTIKCFWIFDKRFHHTAVEEAANDATMSRWDVLFLDWNIWGSVLIKKMSKLQIGEINLAKQVAQVLTLHTTSATYASLCEKMCHRCDRRIGVPTLTSSSHVHFSMRVDTCWFCVTTVVSLL